MTIQQTFKRLGKSKFRSRFRLSQKDREYISNKGMEVIRSHAEELQGLRRRIFPMTASKRLCAVTRCLRHSMPAPAVAGVA